jgi:hypothetical protein
VRLCPLGGILLLKVRLKLEKNGASFYSDCLRVCVGVWMCVLTHQRQQQHKKKKLEIAGLRLTSVFWGGKVE